MKNASSGLITYLNTQRLLIYADLWTFTLKNGTVLRYTNWDTDLTVSGNTFTSHDVILANGRLKWTRGLEVNETDLTCYPNLLGPISVVGTIPFLQACKQGLLDRATAQRERLFMPTPNNTSLGTVLLFLGEVTDLTITQNTAVLKCKDATNLLNMQMPRRQYQPTCPWTFGDSNCTFNRSSLTKTSAVISGSSGTSINCALTDAAGTYNYGVVTFTSGLNSGMNRAIKSWIPETVTLTGPFPFQPQVGDAFTITPGCSKNLNGSSAQFNASIQQATTTPNVLVVGLINAAGYFNNGTLLMTSGACVGQSQIISSWANGTAVLAAALSQTPAPGDECVLTSAVSNDPNTCQGFSNIINFGGQPFVPVPETAY